MWWLNQLWKMYFQILVNICSSSEGSQCTEQKVIVMFFCINFVMINLCQCSSFTLLMLPYQTLRSQSNSGTRFVQYASFSLLMLLLCCLYVYFFLFRKDTYFIHLYLFLHLWHYSLFNLLSTSFTAILCFLFSFFSCHYSVTCYWLWLKVFSFEAKNSFILHIFIVQTMWLLFSWGQGFIH